MSFYTEAYKHKPNDVISREDGTLWRRQTPKLLYPLGQCWKHMFLCLDVSLPDCICVWKHVFVTFSLVLSVCSGVGQTNLRMPQGCFGLVCEGKQLSVGEQGVLVRWDYSYSSWTLFTCEIEMLLHVVSTAGTNTQNLHVLSRDVIFPYKYRFLYFSDFCGKTHVIRVDPIFSFLLRGEGEVGWLLHDDWNRANGLELLPK